MTVIGDAVNTAARVESATRQTDDDLLITETTRQFLSEEMGGWEERPPVSLKGKAEEVRLYGSRASANPMITADNFAPREFGAQRPRQDSNLRPAA